MLSPVIGLTIVAFGTGAPKLATGIGSSLAVEAERVLGNVIGSNLIDLLGAAANPALPLLEASLRYFALPLATLTLALSLVHHRRQAT